MSSVASVLEEYVELGLLDPNEIPRILTEQARNGVPVEDVLIAQGWITDRERVQFRAFKLQMAFTRVEEWFPDPSVVTLIPEDLALEKAVIALEKTETTLTLAMADPRDVGTIDKAQLQSRLRADVVLGSRGEILKKLAEYRMHYNAIAVKELLNGSLDQAVALSKRLGLTGSEFDLKAGRENGGGEQHAVIKAVNLLLLEAVGRRASDIHLVPGPKGLIVKYRVDGVLATGQILPLAIAPNIVSRIKVLAKLDISEKRMPQDGAFFLRLDSNDLNLRVGTMPTIYGEKAVLRILDSHAMVLGLENVGFSANDYDRIKRNILRTNGINLVVGPTGSGKTTTLYSILQTLNNDSRNITTIEDPVEQHIEGITQIQVNQDIGLSFSAVLRALLRQDPDVIFLGEIRDPDSAQIAIRAAMTGHLVVATLHANSAAAAIVRLLDMGVEPFFIASTLRCVVSQRLVRMICVQCREQVPVRDEQRKLLPEFLNNVPVAFQGKGCNYCFDSGYHGRTIIAETLEVSDDVRHKILDRASEEQIMDLATTEGMIPVLKDGITKALDGHCTIDQVLHACDVLHRH